MSKEYTIDIISEKVKNWSNQFGDFSTYTVKLAGSDDAVDINKKSDSPAPKSGEVIYGELQETAFGLKFKSEKRPFGEAKTTPTSSNTPTESHDTQDSIYRSVALNDAAIVYQATGEPSEPILKLADEFYGWLHHEPTITLETVKRVFEENGAEDHHESERDWSSLHKSKGGQEDDEQTE